MLFNLFVKYIPFWSIPLMIISMQMGWTFKKRGKRGLYKFAIVSFVFSLSSLSYFFYKGTPKRSIEGVESFKEDVKDFVK